MHPSDNPVPPPKKSQRTTPLPTFAHAATLSVRPVSGKMQRFVAQHMSSRADTAVHIRSLESGGGGDCLFHSFAAAFEQMIQRDPDAGRHILARASLESFTGSSRVVVNMLRDLSASAVLRWHEEKLLDYVLNRVMNQRLGTFQDSWNPRELMVRCGFECLLDCETILSFGPVPDGDPNDAAVRVARTVARRGGGAREETIIVVPQGMTKLVTLREGVRDELLRGSTINLMSRISVTSSTWEF